LGEDTQASHLIVLLAEPRITVLPPVEDAPSSVDEEDSEGPGLFARLIFDSLGERSREDSLQPIIPHIDTDTWIQELTDRMRTRNFERILAPDVTVRVTSDPLTAIRTLGEQQSSLLITLRMGL